MSWRKGIETDVSVAPDRSYLTRHDDWSDTTGGNTLWIQKDTQK